MSEYIRLKEAATRLSGYIRFSMTKKAMEAISENTNKAIQELCNFSRRNSLIITPEKAAGKFAVHTATGILICRIADDENSLLVIGFKENTLLLQNIALKNGIIFDVDQGIIIQIKIRDYNYFFDICNGTKYESNYFAEKRAFVSIQAIREKLSENRYIDPVAEPEIEEYQPAKKLSKLLDKAESYSTLASGLEEKKAHETGNVAYTNISAVEYDRIDRVVYQFAVKELDENVFKVGVQVEIEDKEHVRHTAEIIELIKKDQDSPAEAIQLLFTDHLDISKLNNIGLFNISFSSVNKDVQLAAIDKIRTGKATAQYMDGIFGQNTSMGFDNLDLSEIRAKLLEKEYPPNDSQMSAIFSGINVRDVFLVMGPPGTGKTTVILEWVKYFVKQGKRVLVSSQNNKAVDNVLARIAEEKDIDIIRIGSEAKLQSEVVPYMFENKIKSLRERIASNSDKKISVLSGLYELGDLYVNTLDEVEDAIKVVTQRREFLHAYIKQNILPVYTELCSTLKEFQAISSNKIHLVSCLNRYINRLARYDRIKNGFIKFLLKIFWIINTRGLKKTHNAFIHAEECELSLVKRYKQLHLTYTREYAVARDEKFAALLQARNREQSVLSRTNSVFATAENPWGLFSSCAGRRIDSIQMCQEQRILVNQELIRVRKLASLISGWKSSMEERQNYALNEIILESVNLVGATCIGINSQKRFAGLRFDVTIIDEAGQIQVHNALVPMSVSNKLIMLGDHKQIPPSADQELVDLCEENGVQTDLLHKSLFEQMYNDLPDANKIMLDTQYRMPAEIADTISDWFYEGKYYSPDFKRNKGSLISWLSDKPYVIIDTSRVPERYERAIPDAGSDNPLEAKIIAYIIAHLASTPGSNLKEIGIISAYKSQVKLIRNNLAAVLKGDKSLINEMVATLDSYQGQERDIILYSFTKTSEKHPYKRRIGFLNELRRLNVAMTRAKKMLVLIGDMEFLGGCMHCSIDEDRNPIYDQSERQFADFIKKMVSDVKSGQGELLTVQEFYERNETA